LNRLLARRNRRAFSAFYGAMGVLLVCTAIMGLLLVGHGQAGDTAPRERELASHFLEALLHSTVANGTTLDQALANSCFALHCPRGTWNGSALGAAIDGLAAPLARALDRAYKVAVTAENLTEVRVGNLPPGTNGATAATDIFRPVQGAFLGVSVLLAPAGSL
jgi:hypothetical protein